MTDKSRHTVVVEEVGTTSFRTYFKCVGSAKYFGLEVQRSGKRLWYEINGGFGAEPSGMLHRDIDVIEIHSEGKLLTVEHIMEDGYRSQTYGVLQGSAGND